MEIFKNKKTGEDTRLSMLPEVELKINSYLYSGNLWI